MRVFEHGADGPWVIAIHGGPAAAGSAAPIARGLAHGFRVLEPWQRGSGEQPLTVSLHIADLHDLIVERCSGTRPALVGESWGAMLVLAYAAEHPQTAGPLALVGCGTFDTIARARLVETLEQRKSDALRAQLARLDSQTGDADRRQAEEYRLTMGLYDYEPIEPSGGPPEDFDIRAHNEAWQDMLRLQAEGIYPGAFASIATPAIMLHGTYDPHPGAMTFARLKRIIPQLEYREFERCGHSPWNEGHARDEFFRILREWLIRHCAAYS